MFRCSTLAVAGAALTILLLGGCAGGSQTKRGPLHLYQMARVMYEQGKVTEALDYLDRSIAQDDRNPQVHFYLGYILWSRGQWYEATEKFQRAIELNAYYTDARIYLATCWNELGDPVRALQELDRALADRTYPTPEQIHLNIALIQIQGGDVEEALAHLRQAVEVNPRFYRAHLEIARLLDGLDRSGEALPAFRVAAPGYPDDAPYHLDYGVALFRAGRYEDALEQLHRVIELAPGSSQAVKAGELIAIIEGD